MKCQLELDNRIVLDRSDLPVRVHVVAQFPAFEGADHDPVLQPGRGTEFKAE